MAADGYALIGYDGADTGGAATAERALALGAARIALVAIADSESAKDDLRGYRSIEQGQGLASPIVMKSRVLATVEDPSIRSARASSVAVLYFAKR